MSLDLALPTLPAGVGRVVTMGAAVKRRSVFVVAALALATGAAFGACAGSSSTSAGSGDVTTTTVPAIWTGRITNEVEVGGLYRQGLAKVPGGWVFSFNDGLYRTDEQYLQSVVMQPAIPDAWKAKGYDHLGDIDVVDGVLYAPLEQPDYEQGHQAVLLYDAETLAYRSGFEVVQHHNSFVTVDAGSGIAYSMDRFGGDALLRYDTADSWKPLDPVPMSQFVDKVQGGDVADGVIWLSTDDVVKGVYRVDLATGAVQQVGSLGHLDGEGEGIDATLLPSGLLHALSIDAKVVPVRLIDLQVSASG